MSVVTFYSQVRATAAQSVRHAAPAPMEADSSRQVFPAALYAQVPTVVDAL